MLDVNDASFGGLKGDDFVTVPVVEKADDGGLGIFSNRIIQSAVESLPVTGATAAVSMVAGLPVGLSSMFAVVFADSYGRNTAEGMDDALAVEDAAVNAGFEVLTEIPFLRFLKGSSGVAAKTIRERIKNTLKGAGYEGFGEAINSILAGHPSPPKKKSKDDD